MVDIDVLEMIGPPAMDELEPVRGIVLAARDPREQPIA
jgi:hypothetical protein